VLRMTSLLVMAGWCTLLVGYALVLARSTHPEH
jgi:hypothetical protein